jgi:hypothetical protein
MWRSRDDHAADINSTPATSATHCIAARTAAAESSPRRRINALALPHGSAHASK